MLAWQLVLILPFPFLPSVLLPLPLCPSHLVLCVLLCNTLQKAQQVGALGGNRARCDCWAGSCTPE